MLSVIAFFLLYFRVDDAIASQQPDQVQVHHLHMNLHQDKYRTRSSADGSRVDASANVLTVLDDESDLLATVEESCALVGTCQAGCPLSFVLLLENLAEVYADDSSVFIGILVLNPSVNSSDETYVSDKHNCEKLVFYPRQVRDRSCLLSPPAESLSKIQSTYTDPLVLNLLVQYLNHNCHAFRTPTGSMLPAGILHRELMSNLFHIAEPVEQCQELDHIPSVSEFFQDYLFHSRPLVIRGGAADWTAMKKWTTSYLREKYGDKVVHIKLTPDGNFEGVENVSLWSGYFDFIPTSVRTKLLFPDLVVVRPATRELKFSDFLDLIMAKNKSYSAYLEYSSITHYMPHLEEDIAAPPFLNGLLQRQHLNMWLSDGNTLGKLHFDPYDNFLCQISGEKQLTLFEPHRNEDLYEAHIPEAILGFDAETGKFRRKTLLQSTSMVMSPVDITNPDLEKFPNFARIKRVECRLKPGDMLYLPAFWWHEVQSFPSLTEQRNLAVNYWYTPMYQKEFPCAECRLHFNMLYRELLENRTVFSK